MVRHVYLNRCVDRERAQGFGTPLSTNTVGKIP
jgi:hypothetical protein